MILIKNIKHTNRKCIGKANKLILEKIILANIYNHLDSSSLVNASKISSELGHSHSWYTDNKDLLKNITIISFLGISDIQQFNLESLNKNKDPALYIEYQIMFESLQSITDSIKDSFGYVFDKYKLNNEDKVLNQIDKDINNSRTGIINWLERNNDEKFASEYITPIISNLLSFINYKRK